MPDDFDGIYAMDWPLVCASMPGLADRPIVHSPYELLRECSIKTAVAMAVEISGVRKKVLYQAALVLAGRE